MKVPISISFEFLGHFRPKGCIKSQDVRYVRYVHSSAFPCQCRLSELFTSLSSLKTFKGKEWSWICICTYNIFEIQIQFEFWQIAYQIMFQKEVLRNKLSCRTLLENHNLCRKIQILNCFKEKIYLNKKNFRAKNCYFEQK